MPSFDPLPSSNAAMSKNAKDATEKANIASDNAAAGQSTHAQAASMHRSAAYANRDAGNATQAKKHEVAAALHEEKAKPEAAAKNFADAMGKHADAIGKKADMAHAAGSSPINPNAEDWERSSDAPRDPRTASELHAAASKAHDKAAKAAQLAGDDDKQKYHEGKATEHIEKGKNALSLEAGASES